MKTKYSTGQTCEIPKSKIIFILFILLFSCKYEKIKPLEKEIKTSVKIIDCNITKEITDRELLNNSIAKSFKSKKDSIKLYSIFENGKLKHGFGKKIVCNYIEKENITSSVVYYMGNDYLREISELHFKKGSAQKSFNKLKSELILCSNQKNVTNELYNEFFDFMKTGLVFLLDKKNDTIIIIEYNIFINPKNHKEIMKFIELNKNNYDEILLSEGYPKIKIFK
jgi:hypothetical protein